MKHFIATLAIVSIFCPRYISSSECTGKTPKKRLPLFQQAEQCTEQLLSALALCQTQSNCPTDHLAQAVRNAHCCRQNLSDHLQALESKTDGSCRMCEKNETLEHHQALSELLATKEAQELLLSFPSDT